MDQKTSLRIKIIAGTIIGCQGILLITDYLLPMELQMGIDLNIMFLLNSIGLLQAGLFWFVPEFLKIIVSLLWRLAIIFFALGIFQYKDQARVIFLRLNFAYMILYIAFLIDAYFLGAYILRFSDLLFFLIALACPALYIYFLTKEKVEACFKD